MSEMGTRSTRLVAIVASAGGLEAITEVLGPLPAGFPAPVLVLQHVGQRYRSHLADILERRVRLRVREATTGDVARPGDVYVAPPAHHLLVDATGRLSLSTTGKVQYARPSADVLLASAAAGYTSGAVAVVLTGYGRDGAAGAAAVRALGGVVLVQDPADCEHGSMPAAAIAAGAADAVLPLDRIGLALIELVARNAE